MRIKIREESIWDYRDIDFLLKKAFENIEHSDHKEHIAVQKIRKGNKYIPKLSLIAVSEGTVCGFCIATEIIIKLEDGAEHKELALAPLAVLPHYQKQGVGKALIDRIHLAAKKLGYKSICLIGMANYFNKFQYNSIEKYNLTVPSDIPNGRCLIHFLDHEKYENGVIEYNSNTVEN